MINNMKYCDITIKRVKWLPKWFPYNKRSFRLHITEPADATQGDTSFRANHPYTTRNSEKK